MRLHWIVALATTACAMHDGSWPSLSRRPIEGASAPTTGRCVTALPSCVPDRTADATVGTVPVAVRAEGSAANRAAANVSADVPSTAVTDSTAIDDTAAKLAVIAADLDDVGARLASQRQAAAAAAVAARGTPTASPAWAKAELERTALDRIGSQIDDVRQRLNEAAGTLAAASATGGNVAAPLAKAGHLIDRVEALRRDYAAAAAAVS